MRYTRLSPWPDDALRFTCALERVARLIAAARCGMSSNWDLTIPGWRMLQLVSKSDGDFTLARIARRLGIAGPSAHATAGCLQRAGMLELRCAPEDRRMRKLVLTQYGAECLSDLGAAIQMLLLEVTSDISRESLQGTADLLNRMTNRLQRCETALKRPARFGRMRIEPGRPGAARVARKSIGTLRIYRDR